MMFNYSKDTRPKPNGHYATINRKRYATVLVDNVQRFPQNRIIRDLLDAAQAGQKLDLNGIAIRAANGAYCKEEMRELYRLIGYSVCGFSEVFEDDKIGSSMWKR
jgi:hypothetical protein